MLLLTQSFVLQCESGKFALILKKKISIFYGTHEMHLYFIYLSDHSGVHSPDVYIIIYDPVMAVVSDWGQSACEKCLHHCSRKYVILIDVYSILMTDVKPSAMFQMNEAQRFSSL